MAKLRQVRVYERLAVERMEREVMVMLCREWFDLYGEPPRALDWDYGALRRRNDEAGMDKLLHGGWPTTNQVKREFGTFTDFIVISGFYPRMTMPLWKTTPFSKRSFYLREAVHALKEKLGEDRKTA